MHDVSYIQQLPPLLQWEQKEFANLKLTEALGAASAAAAAAAATLSQKTLRFPKLDVAGDVGVAEHISDTVRVEALVNPGGPALLIVVADYEAAEDADAP